MCDKVGRTSQNGQMPFLSFFRQFLSYSLRFYRFGYLMLQTELCLIRKDRATTPRKHELEKAGLFSVSFQDYEAFARVGQSIIG